MHNIEEIIILGIEPLGSNGPQSLHSNNGWGWGGDRLWPGTHASPPPPPTRSHTQACQDVANDLQPTSKAMQLQGSMKNLHDLES